MYGVSTMRIKLNFFCMLLIAVVAFSFVGCGENLQNYSILVQNYLSYGIVEGSGTYLENSLVTIKTKQNNSDATIENKFLGWIHNNVLVSQEETYTFTIDKETAGTYIAVYKMNEPAVFTISSLSYTPTKPSSTQTNMSLKEVRISCGANDSLYTLFQCITDNLEDTYKIEQLSDFTSPFAFLDINDLYLKIEEVYQIEKDSETNENTTLTKLIKINKSDIKNSIQSETTIDKNVNGFDDENLSKLSFKFNYLENLIDQLNNNTENA